MTRICLRKPLREFPCHCLEGYGIYQWANALACRKGSWVWEGVCWGLGGVGQLSTNASLGHSPTWLAGQRHELHPDWPISLLLGSCWATGAANRHPARGSVLSSGKGLHIRPHIHRDGPTQSLSHFCLTLSLTALYPMRKYHHILRNNWVLL